MSLSGKIDKAMSLIMSILKTIQSGQMDKFGYQRLINLGGGIRYVFDISANPDGRLESGCPV